MRIPSSDKCLRKLAVIVVVVVVIAVAVVAIAVAVALAVAVAVAVPPTTAAAATAIYRHGPLKAHVFPGTLHHHTLYIADGVLQGDQSSAPVFAAGITQAVQRVASRLKHEHPHVGPYFITLYHDDIFFAAPPQFAEGFMRLLTRAGARRCAGATSQEPDHVPGPGMGHT